MKKISYLIMATAFLFSCKKDNTEDAAPEKQTVILQGSITEDMTLDPNVSYLLKGQVYVKNNAQLTIPAGVIIEAEKIDAPESKAALIITKGSKLSAEGTADKPVIFTSAAADKAPGDWIGIIILGKAAVNLENAHAAGLTVSGDTEFGGTSNDDNSGSLKYLRLEYCGGLNPADEEEWEIDKSAGLSLQGVGSATAIEHVVVRNSLDDGFQFVGGTVNAKYLISAENGDDNFDFDRGYTGKLQFIISYHSKPSSHAIRANGFESLNDKDASGLTPFTRPVISNMTVIGPKELTADQSQGVYIRKNTRFVILNSIIAGYTDGALMLCTKTKPILLNDQGSVFEYNLVNCDKADHTFMFDSGPSGTDIVPDEGLAVFAIQTGSEILKASFNNNTIVNAMSDLKLKNVYGDGDIDLSLQNDAEALSGADFSNSDLTSFFTKVNFIGAAGSENWASGNWVK